MTPDDKKPADWTVRVDPTFLKGWGAEVNPGALWVLTVLAYFARDKAWCFVGNKALMEITGLARATLNERLVHLEAKGCIVRIVEAGQRKGNRMGVVLLRRPDGEQPVAIGDEGIRAAGVELGGARNSSRLARGKTTFERFGWNQGAGKPAPKTKVARGRKASPLGAGKASPGGVGNPAPELEALGSNEVEPAPPTPRKRGALRGGGNSAQEKPKTGGSPARTAVEAPGSPTTPRDVTEATPGSRPRPNLSGPDPAPAPSLDEIRAMVQKIHDMVPTDAAKHAEHTSSFFARKVAEGYSPAAILKLVEWLRDKGVRAEKWPTEVSRHLCIMKSRGEPVTCVPLEDLLMLATRS